jgi:class 3 adenylate cyclase
MSPTPNSSLAYSEKFVADLQRQLAECRAERDEALQRETAATEVLQVINSSPGDLAPVFDTILDQATRLCDAAFGVVWTYDRAAKRYRPGWVHRVPAALAKFLGGDYRAAPSGVLNVVGDASFLHILDEAESAGYRTNVSQLRRAMVDLGGARTALAVPLRRHDTVLAIYRQEVRAFSERQIALLQNLAQQAVMAMENARLLTETRAALEQQTGTAEVLQVINSSPGDVAPVFDAMLEKAVGLCEADLGVLRTFDGEAFPLVAICGHDRHIVEQLEQLSPIRIFGLLNPIVRGERVVHVADVRKTATYRNYQNARDRLQLASIRTWLGVALRKEDVLLGVIVVVRREVRPFSDKQIALVKNFAAQAVIAMENARLLGELRTRTNDLEESLQYQTAMSDVLKIISRTDGKIDAVLDTLVRRASHICGADQAVLHQLRDRLHYVVASFGFTPEYEEYVARNPIKPSRGTAIGRMSLESRVIHIHDVLQDAEYSGSEFQRLAEFRTLLAVPLLREDTVIGSLLLTRLKVEPFTEKQIEQVRTFADQAAIAIENARLLGELRQRTDQVAELNRGLEARVAAQVEELGRVGRLKRFLAPQLAELIVSQGDENILESHRREIVVVFCDVRGYTAFTETAEPEEVLDFLREYHGALGPLVAQFEGTLDQFSGDGIMVFFNDPVPIPDPAERAVRMAIAMREAAGALIADWRRRDCELGFGAGIAQGYATLGQIGFAERSSYTAIGTVCNLAARLCAEAKDGQILIAGRVAAAVEKIIALEDLGSLALKGLTQPVSAFNVPLAVTPPALRVIEGGPQSV